MKFPVLYKRPVWPSKPLCPQCKKHKVMEPHSMAILAGGAMRVTDEKNQCAEMMDDGAGFLGLRWHGGHDGGEGVDLEIDASVELADWTRSGQFEFYFCSTACLRAFLNACVDGLEAKIKAARARQSSAPARKKPRRSSKSSASSPKTRHR